MARCPALLSSRNFFNAARAASLSAAFLLLPRPRASSTPSCSTAHSKSRSDPAPLAEISLIFRRIRRTRLQQFLQFALGIFDAGRFVQLAEIGGELAQNKFAAPRQNRRPKKSRRAALQTRPPMRKRVRVRRVSPRHGSKSDARQGRARGRVRPAMRRSPVSRATLSARLRRIGKFFIKFLREDELPSTASPRNSSRWLCARRLRSLSCATDGCVSARRSRFSSRNW